MPKKGSKGESADLPSTLVRSPQKAQDTYEDTLEHAEEEYAGDEARAHRVAWASVKHSFEKVGDHWEPKETRGPSDERSKEGGLNPTGASYGGVDVEGKSKAELVSEARALGVHVTTHMTKAELGESIEHANDEATRKARESS
jgi:cation transport regulator ChaB